MEYRDARLLYGSHEVFTVFFQGSIRFYTDVIRVL